MMKSILNNKLKENSGHLTTKFKCIYTTLQNDKKIPYKDKYDFVQC